MLVFIIGCAHTNEFAKYDMNSKRALFKTYINPDLAKVGVHISTGSDYGHNDAKDIIIIILKEAGSYYIEDKVRDKLRNAVNADSIVTAISSGIKDGLMTYYRINPVESLDKDPQFIVETRLLGFKLNSTPSGIYAKADTKVIITDRGTAKTVWENRESTSVPLYDVFYGAFGYQAVRTATSIINAYRLINMTEEEIRAAVNIAAGEVGIEMTDTLREDIAETE